MYSSIGQSSLKQQKNSLSTSINIAASEDLFPLLGNEPFSELDFGNFNSRLSNSPSTQEDDYSIANILRYNSEDSLPFLKEDEFDNLITDLLTSQK